MSLVAETLNRRDLGPPVVPTSAAPRAPKTLADTGLSAVFVGELILKHLFSHGRLSLGEAGQGLCLPLSICAEVVAFLRAERLVELSGRGATEADSVLQATEAGRARAAEAVARSTYAGPAPITLDAYRARVKAQSVLGLQVTAARMHAAFSDLQTPDGVVDQLGAGLNGGRSMLLFGPAGSGKTFLAERLVRVLEGTVLVPHALTVGGEVIQVFDPLVHVPVVRDTSSSWVRADRDERWVECARPMVVTGGELTLEMLDLHFDPAARFYQAPPHVKANGGVLLVDDLGRQRVNARELLNRWIVPLDRHRDFLALRSGFRFEVPFDVSVLFSTNLSPLHLADDAFLRRFGAKVFVGALRPEQYRSVLEQACRASGVSFSDEGADWLLEQHHAPEGRPLLACYPRDLVGRVRDFAVYLGEPARLSSDAIARAWASYFVTTEDVATPASMPGFTHPT